MISKYKKKCLEFSLKEKDHTLYFLKYNCLANGSRVVPNSNALVFKK